MAEANMAGQILDLIAVFDRPELFHSSPETLVKQVLPAIADQLPDCLAARIYRISDTDSNMLSLWHNVGKSPTVETIDLNQTPAFAVAVRQPKVVVDGNNWLIPLYSEGEKRGVLEIQRKSPSPLAVPDWMQVIGRYFSLVLARAIRHDLEQRQTLTTTRFIEIGRQLALANSYGQIAKTVLEALPDSIDIMGLSLFDRPILGDEIPAATATVAVALRDHAEDLNIKDVVEAESWDLRTILAQLEDGEYLSISEGDRTDIAIARNMLSYVQQDLNIKSLAILSLRIGPRMLGLFTVGALGKLSLDPAALHYLRTLADQVSLVMQSQQALQSAQTTVDQFQHIIAFNQAAEATFDRSAIFHLMLTETAQMFPLDFMNIALYNASEKRLLAVAQRVDGRNQVDLDSEWVISQTNTTSGRIWEQWDLLYIPDMTKESDLYHPLRDDLRAVMGAPIQSRGGALGLVEIGSFTPYAYSDSDVTMFQQMVRQLATTIESAEVYVQGQNLAKNKALAGEIAAELQQQVDLDSILTVTLNQLGQTLGAHRGRIRLSTDFDVKN